MDYTIFSKTYKVKPSNDGHDEDRKQAAEAKRERRRQRNLRNSSERV